MLIQLALLAWVALICVSAGTAWCPCCGLNDSCRVSIALEDAVLTPDLLVFSRILNIDQGHTPHNASVIAITNKNASRPVIIRALDIVGPFEIMQSPALPYTIPAGGAVKLTVVFTGSGQQPDRLVKGGIWIKILGVPNNKIALNGIWQQRMCAALSC